MFGNILSGIEAAMKILSLMPGLLGLVAEAVKAVEEIGGPGTGVEKEESVLGMVDLAYDAASKESNMPVSKGEFRDMASSLITNVVGLHNSTDGLRKGDVTP